MSIDAQLAPSAYGEALLVSITAFYLEGRTQQQRGAAAEVRQRPCLSEREEAGGGGVQYTSIY